MIRTILAVCIILCSFEANALTMKGFEGKINNLSDRDISDFTLSIEATCHYETKKRVAIFVGPTHEILECGSKSESIQINTDGSFEFPKFKYKGEFLPFVSKRKKWVQFTIELAVEGLGVVLKQTIDEDEESSGRTIDDIRDALKIITVFDTKETRVDIAEQSLKAWRKKGISYLDVSLSLNFGFSPDVHSSISSFTYRDVHLISSMPSSTKELLSIERLKNGKFPKQITAPSQLVARLGNNPETMTYEFYWAAKPFRKKSISKRIEVTVDTEDLGQTFFEIEAID